MKTSLRLEMEGKLPIAHERAKTRPKTAIRLFCIECMGGNTRDAKACEVRDCYLWPHRGAAWARKDAP